MVNSWHSCTGLLIFRALEEGDLEAAAMAKEKLENKQREARKPFKNKKENEWWSPRWFVREKHPDTGNTYKLDPLTSLILMCYSRTTGEFDFVFENEFHSIADRDLQGSMT